jgi:superfamily II DNA helicase RecQ
VPADVFEKALEKLWAHGGVTIDAADNLTRATDDWRDSYLAQGEQKQAQIEAMIRYAQSSQCRMSSLVRHFGDAQDSQKSCGICDFCAPENCVAQRFRPANETEQTVARHVLDALRGNGRSVGKLHAELCGKNELDRDAFEELIGAMARSGLVRLTDSVFEKDGKQIPFRKASLTRDAEYVDENTPVELSIRESAAVTEKKSLRRKAAVAAKKAPKHTDAKAEPMPAEPMLKEWRRALAKKLGVPAFRIMSDRVLLAIAENEPRTAAELLAIPGIGIKTAEKHGAQIYRILNEARIR